MKKFYFKLFRRSYKMLRHPRIRKSRWLNSLVEKLFVREYWKPCVHTVAVGLSVGLFCAMLPIPFQSLLTAFGCLKFKGNIPIAICSCWVSNPFTQAPLIYLQEKIGGWLFHHTHLELPKWVNIEGTVPFLDVTVNLGNLIAGVLLTAITMACVVYAMVYLIYALTPKRKIQSANKSTHAST